MHVYTLPQTEMVLVVNLETRNDLEDDLFCHYLVLVYDLLHLVPKGVHENRTKGVENKVDDTLKLVVFLECAQCY